MEYGTRTGFPFSVAGMKVGQQGDKAKGFGRKKGMGAVCGYIFNSPGFVNSEFDQDRTLNALSQGCLRISEIGFYMLLHPLLKTLPVLAVTFPWAGRKKRYLAYYPTFIEIHRFRGKEFVFLF